jgi:fructokinase
MRIGVDLAGAETDVLALAADGSVLRREKAPTTIVRYEEVLETIRSLVSMIERGSAQRGTVGVSLPGAISAKTGRVKNSNNANLIGADLVHDLERKLERSVRIGNDANCFTLAEATDGAAAGGRVVLGLILAGGVGAGIAIERKIVEGANAIAGEVGHNSLPWSSDEESARVRCYCGKSGCVEQFLSLSGLQRAYKTRSGSYVSVEEIVRAAAARQANALACLSEYEDRLARVLGSVINILDPDTIVLGGGLARTAVDYATLPEAVARYAFTDRLDTRIVPSVHGDTAAVRGAAMLWPARAS